MLYSVLFVILLAPFVWRVLSFYWSVLTLRHLPPGPFPLPFLGNLHLIGPNVHVSLTNLAKKFGDLMTIYFGTERAVVVSSAELAREVLVRQSNVFGGRPLNLPYGAVLLSHGGKNIAFREDMTSRWKKQRKVFHSAVKSFGSGLLLLDDQVCDVVEDLISGLRGHLGTPRDLEHDVWLTVSNIICAMTFGTKYKHDDNEFKLIIHGHDVIQQSVTPGRLTDVFPLLRQLPIQQVLELKNAVQRVDTIVARRYREHELAFDDDNIRDLNDAFLKQNRCDAEGEPIDDVVLTDEEVKLIVNDVFVAGIETSAASIVWAVYYLALNPDIQDRIHAEMRRFLDAPPTFRDRRRLPFLQATITEVFRCSSVVPLLLPHRAVSDASVSGFHIPEDTTVLVNAWAIHHDPRIWSDPHTFKPARFIDQNGNYSHPGPFTLFPFSAGRRGCVGEVLGKMIVFVTLGRMFYNYRFSMVSDGSLGTNRERLASIRKPTHFKVIVEQRE